MEDIDATVRADAEEAKSVIADIFKGLPPAAMRNYLIFLHDSVKFLSSDYGDRWGITLFKNRIRLNVGWVEVLVLRRGGLHVLVERELAPSGTRFEGATYQTAPGCDLTKVPFSELRNRLPTLSEAHLSAMTIAAKRKSPKSIREAHSTGVIEYLSTFVHKPVSGPSYRRTAGSGQDYLVLWKYSEALRVKGQLVNRAEGTHATGLAKGDRMFVIVTSHNELYLLGAIEVEQSDKNGSSGTSLHGAFNILPLKGVKWKLRFDSSQSSQLSRDYQMARQVRSRRLLTPQSAGLLDLVLAKAMAHERKQFVALEGTLREFTLLKRERDPNVRANALVERGTRCEICGFDFEDVYGEFATTCVEVHHIHLLADAEVSGTTTSVTDVIVVCPNCHRALHRYEDPEDWKAFQKACGLA